jgi:hypothetical protein
MGTNHFWNMVEYGNKCTKELFISEGSFEQNSCKIFTMKVD